MKRFFAPLPFLSIFVLVIVLFLLHQAVGSNAAASLFTEPITEHATTVQPVAGTAALPFLQQLALKPSYMLMQGGGTTASSLVGEWRFEILSSYEFDWDGAEREFKLAIQLDPFHAHAHQHYANFLIKMGYFDEALNEINKAFSLDPLSIAINLTMGKIFYFARKHTLAIKKARELLEIEPRYSAANGLIVIGMESKFAGSVIWAMKLCSK